MITENQLTGGLIKHTSTGGLAAYLHAVADSIISLGDVEISPVWAIVGLQATGDDTAEWPQRKATIDLLASAFGETAERSGNQYLANVHFGFNVYGAYPTAARARRAELLAQLAQLDAEVDGEVAA